MKILFTFLLVFFTNFAFAKCPDIDQSSWRFDTLADPWEKSTKYTKQQGFWFLDEFTCEQLARYTAPSISKDAKKVEYVRKWQFYKFSNYSFGNHKNSNVPVSNIAAIQVARFCNKNGEFLPQKKFDRQIEFDRIMALLDALFEANHLTPSDPIFELCK